MLKLYEIAAAYRNALSALDDENLQLSPDVIRDTLDGLLGAFEDKAVAVAAYVLNIEAEAEAVAAAEARFKARRQQLEKRAAWLRDYLLSNMEAAGITEIAAKDRTFRVRIRINPESVELEGLPELPDEFVRVKIVREPDRGAIMAALKSGRAVPGARIVRRHRLEIK